ncbi:ras association domain-containing protein 9 isoform X2 [Rhinatrema bivittatum]|nr:ras association domain-containing protein 9 isoform X2 [Rhinatrema bivittatum]XP_029452938.1 ras association domain-containing protein 9 isoform X2 [Rhinatrema bivittatum]XP_029452939.1 ras association domain-containing protein 9 isoform X2 [Rhinatrema bivittatum]
MDSDEKEIVVWVCQEEKIVFGLTKHTSCAEVVEALIEEHQITHRGKRFLLGRPSDYCIVEKWRGFERALPPPTKILKLWKAWGKEQPNLNFVLVKSDAFLPFPMWRTAEAKIVQNLGRQKEHSPAHYVKTLPVDKQKRVVRKAFRKLAKIKQDVASQDRDKMETLVHLIISQDHTIHQQINRMKELDVDIERCEAMLHLDRIENEGEYYVQNAYLLNCSNCSNKEMITPCSQNKKLENLDKNDGTSQVDEQLTQHTMLIESLSAEIEKEIQSICRERNAEEMQMEGKSPDESENSDLESIKFELDKSMKSGLQLYTYYNCLQKDLKHSDLVLQKKANEYDVLVEEFHSLHIVDKSDYRHCLSDEEQAIGRGATGSNVGVCNSSFRITNLDINDTDSDTGISSTHSQDSENALGDVILIST